MKKIEPIDWTDVCELEGVDLYTDDALYVVAEAVYEAVLKVAYTSEGEVLLEKEIDISAIINQLKES